MRITEFQDVKRKGKKNEERKLFMKVSVIQRRGFSKKERKGRRREEEEELAILFFRRRKFNDFHPVLWFYGIFG